MATHQHPVAEQEIIEVVEHVNGNEENNNKRRKRESKVWNEMTKHKREDGKVWAKCIHCKKEFDGSSKKGTTHLKNHLESCRKKRKGGEDAEKSIKTSELTSSLVKGNSVIDLINNCFDERGRPTEDWDPSVLNSRKVDILQIYKVEKEKLRRFFSQLSARVSLRIENFEYWYILTAHYIDEKWELKSKIISFINYEYCGFEYCGLIETLKQICLDLNIDGNICSVVNDKSEDDVADDVIGEINSWFTQQGSLPFGGFLNLLYFSIYDHIYYGTREVLQNLLYSISNCVAYVKETPSNQDKFQIAVDRVKSMGKKVTSKPLPTDVSDVADLMIPLGYKEAFCELEQIDPDFKIINLTKEKWDEATAAEELWNAMNKVWHLFPNNSTLPSMYFSKFCDLYVNLLLATSESYYQGKNMSSLTETFAYIRREFIDKYWSKYNLVLVITMILDPRFKMDIVKLWYYKIYGCDGDQHLEKIKYDFNHVYNEYAKGIKTSSISFLDKMGRPCVSSLNLISPNSELDRYLNEPKFPSVEEFDILAWWRLYSPFFPTLARMARDFLAVPIYHNSLSDRLWSFADSINADEELDDDIKPALAYLSVLEEMDTE